MRFEETDVWGFKHAIRGCRNPLESWHKSDSYVKDDYYGFTESSGCGRSCIACKYKSGCNIGSYVIGDNDMTLLQTLIKAGSDERKFMRQIIVSVDITASMFWFSEFDTYKIGTVSNSTSKMHKLSSTPITADCFESDDMCGELVICDEDYVIKDAIEYIINILEKLRIKFIKTKDKRYWKELIRLLPESWLQKRTITLNYEVLRNMYFARRNHKLSEWHTFCDWIGALPYAKELIMYEGGDKN